MLSPLDGGIAWSAVSGRAALSYIMALLHARAPLAVGADWRSAYANFSYSWGRRYYPTVSQGGAYTNGALIEAIAALLPRNEGPSVISRPKAERRANK